MILSKSVGPDFHVTILPFFLSWLLCLVDTCIWAWEDVFLDPKIIGRVKVTIVLRLQYWIVREYP